MKLFLPCGTSWLRQQCERILLIGVMGGLCGFTSISAVHEPLYRAESHISIVMVTAVDSLHGINKITLSVTTGEITECTELGAIPCRKNPNVIQHLCRYPDSFLGTAQCNYKFRVGDRTMVTYVAEAESKNGERWSSETITYAGGLPPNLPVAIPVWWHKDVPLVSTLDIGFFPDQDYVPLNYSRFTKDLELIIKGAFFNPKPNELFAKLYNLIRGKKKDIVNIWTAPFGADAVSSCRGRNFSAPAIAPIAGLVDGRVIVHTEDFTDCAAISLGGGGTVNVSDASKGRKERADVIFVHESGHFLHGLADEYEGGGHATAGPCVNVFSSKAACEAASPVFITAPNCILIPGSTVWHDEQHDARGVELYDIMKDLGEDADWQSNCKECVQQRFANCSTGYCY